MMRGIGGEGFPFSILGYRRGIARVSPEYRQKHVGFFAHIIAHMASEGDIQNFWQETYVKLQVAGARHLVAKKCKNMQNHSMTGRSGFISC